MFSDTLMISYKDEKKRYWILLDLSRIITGRGFFWTRSGFMGIGPVAAKVNDTICALFSGQVLYVVM